MLKQREEEDTERQREKESVREAMVKRCINQPQYFCSLVFLELIRRTVHRHSSRLKENNCFSLHLTYGVVIHTAPPVAYNVWTDQPNNSRPQRENVQTRQDHEADLCPDHGQAYQGHRPHLDIPSQGLT
jgi:hypothetical protein